MPRKVRVNKRYYDWTHFGRGTPEEQPARDFLTGVLIDHRQPEESRLLATERFIRIAGFDAWPVQAPLFGAIMPREMAGPDGKAATEWLVRLLNSMNRDKFEAEVDHIAEALKKRNMLVRRGNDGADE